MSKVVLEYTGFLDYVEVAAATVLTGWYPGNVGILSSAELIKYAGGSAEAMYIIVDAPTELVAPPTGKLVTVLHGQGKIQVVPDSVSDWTNVFVGPLADWAENDPIYATSGGKLTQAYNATPDASSGSKQVGKVVVAPAAANAYTLTMIVTI